MDMDVPEHAAERLQTRGVSPEEVEKVVRDGWPASDAAPGSVGRTMVFPFQAERKGRWFAEKEVTVYWKEVAGRRVLLTAKTRFGSGFPRQS